MRSLLDSSVETLCQGLVSGPPPEGELAEGGRALTFREFVSKVAPHYRWYRHNEELAKVADAIVEGRLKRVMIWVPPGTGKSETITRLLAAYYVYRFPGREVGLVSSSADLAEDLAGDARDYFLEAGGDLDPSTNAKRSWYTRQGGGMWGRGMRGQIRGRRYHLGIVDDLHKGPEELDSEILAARPPRFWQRLWLNRQNLFFEEGAAIVIVMQRLAPNDICGWLLEQPGADEWTVVAFDAIKSEEPFEVPKGVELWPDWRRPGELLCEALLSLRKLVELRADEEAFDAQYMQRPRKASGTIFKEEWFDRRVSLETLPLLLRRVMGVDLAVTKKTQNDEVAGITIGYGVNGKYYLFPPVWGRFEAPESEDAVAARARANRATAICVEAVAYQLSFVQHLRTRPELAGITLEGVNADMDKIARAKGWAPFARDGLLVLVDDGSGWIERFIKIAVKFPRVRHDDVIDAIAIAMAGVRQLGGDNAAPLVGGQR